MQRAVMTAVFVSMVGCSLIPGAVRPPVDVGDALAASRATAEFLDKKKECDAFSTLQVPYAEETSIGGAVALSLAKHTKTGVYVELSPELKDLPSIDPAKFATKKAIPAKGERTDLNRYLNIVGKGLAAYSERPTIDWTFAVLDSDTPNAFSAPGGYVFVTTGLLKMLDNEAQLAGVLGHEIGHVTGRHALESYKKSKGIACYGAYFGEKLAGEGSAAVRSALGSAADGVERVPFADELVRAVSAAAGGFSPDKASKDLIRFLANKSADGIVSAGFDSSFERDADATAAKLMIFAGYDVGEFEKVLAKLPDGSFFSPHPTTANRVAVIKDTRAQYEGFAAAAKAPALGPAMKALK